jgi:hypothetical protein
MGLTAIVPSALPSDSEGITAKQQAALAHHSLAGSWNRRRRAASGAVCAPDRGVMKSVGRLKFWLPVSGTSWV